MTTKTGNSPPSQTSLLAERPASRSAPQEQSEDSMTLAVNSRLSILRWLHTFVLGGSSGKTSLTHSTLPCHSLSTKLQSGGIARRGEYLTASVSEFHKGAVDYSLWDILETAGRNLRRYYLTARAAAGFLKRGKSNMPPEFREALEECIRRAVAKEKTHSAAETSSDR